MLLIKSLLFNRLLCHINVHRCDLKHDDVMKDEDDTWCRQRR